MISSRLVLALLSFGSTPYVHAEIAAPAAATQSAEPARTPTARRVSPLIAALDVNHDGTVSASEIAQAPLVLQALDVNGDGLLTVAELRGELTVRRSHSSEAAVRTARTWRPGMGFTLAFALDANHDGDIQMMEIINASSSLRTLDRNHDGQLTADELRFDLPARETALALAN